jgi:hypothetical protein
MAQVVPDPDFTDSRAVRIFCARVRQILHRGAMELHIAASELEAALETVPAVSSGITSARSVQRRRARRVARHLKYSAECMVAGSQGAIRTWGSYKAEFLPNAGVVRRKPTHTVTP